jgi:hypothetical protein
MTDRERRVPGWLLPVALGAAVVALVAIALTRGPVTLDPESAEGTVQEYLLAINEERWDDALSVIHDDWRGRCDEFDLEMYAQGDFSAELGSPSEFGGFVNSGGFVVEGEGNGAGPTIPANTSQVEVTITREDAGGFGGGWEEYVVFELTDDGDFWWIVGDPWPYFVWSCQT